MTSQRAHRFPARCSGFLVMTPSTETIRLQTLDVSREGLKATLERPVHFGSRMIINVVIGECNVADLVVYPLWGNEDNVFGFRIETASDNWPKFIDGLSPQGS